MVILVGIVFRVLPFESFSGEKKSPRLAFSKGFGFGQGDEKLLNADRW